MNSIILVDDNPDFIRDFTNDAFTQSITVAPANSLEGLQKLLPLYAHRYAGVVLDIKCLLKDNQAKEDASFITAALKFLDSTIPEFPRFILTGDESEFSTLKRYYTEEKMFIKEPEDLKRLFGELVYCVKNAEPLRIKRENIAIFKVFDQGLLPPNKEVTVLNIIKRNNENDPKNFKGIIADIREVHEEIYKSLNRRNKNIVPDRYLNGNGSPSFNASFYKHLLGNPDPKNNYVPSTTVYQDSTISSQTKLIHGACSEFLHDSSQNSYLISEYTVKSLVNALLELILWSKQY